MTFYYQCECGERINKLTGEFANSKEEILDNALYDTGKNLVQCPKCGTKYEVKMMPRKILNIAIFVWFVVAAVLKFTLGIEIYFMIGMIFVGIIVGFVFQMFFSRLEKITDEHNTKGSANET